MSHSQLELFDTTGETPFIPNDHPYLREQLITYIGNKRALLGFIGTAVDRVRKELGRETLAAADLFSGSGIVARFLKGFTHRLVVNDLELYAEIINRCYLSNSTDRDEPGLREIYGDITSRLARDEENDSFRPGILAQNYAPRDDSAIQPGERVFYTRRNALYLDTARLYIEELDPRQQPYVLAPLLVKASIHANTAGVFKGFYKDSGTGIGRFGGTAADALSRITGPIHLPFPVFGPRDCAVEVHRQDANHLASRIESEQLDLVYLDPPYNQHPYGSNYFMLNLIARNKTPETISSVSGIPSDWNRSAYNSTRRAASAFEELVRSLNTRYLLVSFSNEGFLARDTILGMLEQIGSVEVMEQRYNTFRGSRNLGNRSTHVQEYLFLVRRI